MSGLLEAVRAHRAEIHALAARYGAQRVRVFGSVARGEERPDSDIDFLVDYPKVYDLFGQRLPLARALEELLGRKVDVVPERELHWYIKDTVCQEAVPL